MRNTLPISGPSPPPSDRLKRSTAALRMGSELTPSGIITVVTELDADAPGIHLALDRRERRDGVGEQQRGVLGLIHGTTDVGYWKNHARRGLVVDAQHGLDLVCLVLGQPVGEPGDIGALAPVG